jgi:hypothetical protein
MNTVLPPVQVITKKIVKGSFDLFYPFVIGLTNAVVQHKINTEILNVVNGLITKQGYYNNSQTQITGWYEIKTNERGILSLSVGNYAYPPHAAHGMTYIISLTFDVITGKLYQLSELFKPNSDYVKIISDNITLQIKERDIPLLEGFNTIKPNQDFYIADKALVIYFQLYEIAPYYVGLPMFPISVFSLQDLSLENGPLDRMANNG